MYARIKRKTYYLHVGPSARSRSFQRMKCPNMTDEAVLSLCLGLGLDTGLGSFWQWE